MQRVVIEYSHRTYTPPPLADVTRAATITATVTGAQGRDASQVSGSGSLCHLREMLGDVGFEHHGIQPARLYTDGRYRPLWREVWSKEEEEKNMSSNWSLEAQKAARWSPGPSRNYQEEEETMQAGPRLADNGYTLVVPSCWYQLEAKAFWKSYGFRFDRDLLEWRRDTRRLHQGKRYTAAAWLESTRREFYEFWPKLKGDTDE